MKSAVVAIIGTGNMGTSLISGLIDDGYPFDKLWGTNPNQEKLTYLQNRFRIHTTTNNAEAVKAADVVIFAIKPQIFAQVATELAPVIQTRKPLVISIAAGIRASSIQHWLGGNMAIVRAMPNTPAFIRSGVTALYANTLVTKEQASLAESMLRAVGTIVWLEKEEWMDAVTALSGSGPAYFFLIMEALQQTAEQLGLPSETARLLTLQTALGAARMAIESGVDLEELRRSVTSPGGTTERAVSVLEENNIRGLFRKALHAAKLRSEELADIMEKKS